MRGDFFAIGLVVETLGIDRLFLFEIMVSCFSDVTSEKRMVRFIDITVSSKTAGSQTDV